MKKVNIKINSFLYLKDDNIRQAVNWITVLQEAIAAHPAHTISLNSVDDLKYGFDEVFTIDYEIATSVNMDDGISAYCITAPKYTNGYVGDSYKQLLQLMSLLYAFVLEYKRWIDTDTLEVTLSMMPRDDQNVIIQKLIDGEDITLDNE